MSLVGKPGRRPARKEEAEHHRNPLCPAARALSPLPACAAPWLPGTSPGAAHAAPPASRMGALPAGEALPSCPSHRPRGAPRHLLLLPHSPACPQLPTVLLPSPLGSFPSSSPCSRSERREPLPWASPPLVSTAMALPAPERFSKNLGW